MKYVIHNIRSVSPGSRLSQASAVRRIFDPGSLEDKEGTDWEVHRFDYSNVSPE